MTRGLLASLAAMPILLVLSCGGNENSALAVPVATPATATTTATPVPVATPATATTPATTTATPFATSPATPTKVATATAVATTPATPTRSQSLPLSRPRLPRP